jgi:hypothetical protein
MEINVAVIELKRNIPVSLKNLVFTEFSTAMHNHF